MLKGRDLEQQVYESAHIHQVMTEIEANFPTYFKGFAQQQPLNVVFFNKHIGEYQKEQDAYREYLDLETLDEFEYDPNAFKSYTRKQCPIIRRCLMSRDEVMKAYRRSFNRTTGRQLLDTVRNIAEFGISYVADFDDNDHEDATTYEDLGLELLNDGKYQCAGVIGYGIQSSLLYGLYPSNFAHRSQNAVWSLYFLSGRKSFDLDDDSEFLMVRPDEGTCEQNFFYPAELFGFYALSVFVMLELACEDWGVTFENRYRYIYLSKFCDYVADTHRDDINMYKRSSDYVENQPWF